MHRRFQSLALALMTLVCLLSTSNASAIYNPQLGTFMQRDPSGTPGFNSAPRIGSGIVATPGSFIGRDARTQMYPDGMNLYAAFHVFEGVTDSSGLNAEDSLWQFDPDPGPIGKREPPKNTERVGRDGRIYERDARWGSDWDFKATAVSTGKYLPEGNEFKESCCRIKIEGNLTNRWYWANSAEGKKEELSELKIEENYWKIVASFITYHKDSFTGKDIPCDGARLIAEITNNQSHLHHAYADRDIFEQDMKLHPNPNYQWALDSAKQEIRYYETVNIELRDKLRSLANGN